MRSAAALILVASVFFGILACDSGPPAQLGRMTHPIVNGTPTSGWPAVGALAIEPSYTYSGDYEHFCTGTLIDPEWVLTAAHCVDTDINSGIETYMISFVIDPDLTTGTIEDAYAADAAIHHQDWDPWNLSHDIALLHLASPVPSAVATPIPHNTVNLSGHTGDPIRWVGYGVNDGYSQTGSGIKRTATGTIGALYAYQITYGTGDNSAMPCSGDSGGATLMSISGAERLVGVISAGDEHCVSDGIDTRVDAYQSWISTTMAGGVVEQCDIEGGDCPNQACYPVSETELGCLSSNNKAIGQACDAELTSTLDCADGGLCADIPAGSGGYGEVCYQFCESDAVCAAGEICYLPVFDGIEGIGICLPAPETCTITGGDCPVAQACYPTTSGENYCFPSDEHGEGQACDPSLEDRLSCDDGLICLGSGTNGLCYSFCEGDYDCDAGDTCNIPVFQDVDGLGYCDCIDHDSDGYCADVDCDDGDAAVHPGASEICDDNIDNDCDGLTDEGCVVCTDLDGDGYCAEDDDCDDTNNTIHPGAAERCGNGRDDDCDGQTDEGCSTCTDLDGDGYCAETSDCDDHNSSINPAASEVCHNGLDDDCDGQTDENCGDCTGPADCDDGNPCTIDDCVSGACSYQNEPDGMACGENMMCQIGECFSMGEGEDGGGCASGGAPSGSGLLGLCLLGLALRRRR